MYEGRLNTNGVKDLLLDPEAMATPLLTVILRSLGDDILEEDPLVVYRMLSDEYGVWMTEEGENRYEAMNLAFTTDLFYTDLESWMSITSVLYEGTLQDLRLIEAQDITIPEILWALYEVELVRDTADTAGRPLDLELSPAIRNFITSAIMQEVEDPGTPDTPEAITPYYTRFLEAQKKKMASQFNQIGIPLSINQLPDIDTSAV